MSVTKKGSDKTIDVSIVVPTYKRSQSLRDALASLCQQECTEGFEILVVDNAPSDELRELVESFLGDDPPVRYVPESRTGLHNARHAGARAARGDILVYVDDDVIAPAGWLEALLGPYADAQVACVGGKTLPKWEVKPPNWAVRFPGYLSLLDRGSKVKELRWPEDIYGCNFSIRALVLLEVGGFNPDSFGDRQLIWYRGDGETGLLEKVYSAGYKVMYTPYGWLYHRVPADRLTIDYFRRRAFDQGISNSYTAFRRNPSWAKLLQRAVLASAHLAFGTMRSSLSHRDQEDNVRLSVRSWFWRGCALHTWRLCRSPSLRRHVLRETYFRCDR
jgi:glycosyltransferase involved in cell wall biosynthesis